MEQAYNKAIQLLKIRPHHSNELAKKLALRGFDREIINEVISKLEQENLIDNDLFVQTLLDNLIKYKTFGFYGLKAKLMQRGVASNDAENFLKNRLSTDEEKEIARRLVEKEKEPNKMKLAQKLQRKGFRSEIISSFLRAF